MQNETNVQSRVHSKVQADLNPQVLTIENESHRHGGPATESHFKLTIVAEKFTSLTRVKRHQHVYALLAEELANGVHALALHLYSPSEWEQDKGSVPASPDCRGGSKSASKPDS